MTDYIHKVQYYETDKMGIVHHSNYIRWFEEARIDWLSKIGCDMKYIEDEGVMIPVVSVECKYRAMVSFGEDVVIKVGIDKFNGTRIDVSYEIYDKESGELRTTGKSSHCFINKEGKLISIKKDRPDMYEKMLKAI